MTAPIDHTADIPAGPRERLTASAELAWELRTIDAGRSLSLAEEISREATRLDDSTLATAARIIRLAARQGSEGAAAILDDLDELRRGIATEPAWAGRLENLAGLAERSLGNPSGAMEHHRRALEIAERSGDAGGIAFSLHNIGIVHYTLGDYPAALRSYERAASMRENQGDRTGLAATINNIAMAYRALGDYPAALHHHRRALAIREECDDRAGIAASLNNIGMVHYWMDDYPAALEHYSRSLAIQEERGDRSGISVSLNNIGNVHHALGDHHEALQYCRRCLAIQAEIGDPASIATSLNNIGNAHYSLGDFLTALEYYARSLAIREEIGDRAGVTSSLINIGSVDHELGDHAGALERFTRALAVGQEVGVRAESVRAMIGMARAMIELDDMAGAVVLLERAIAIGMEIGTRAAAADAHAALVGVHEKSGRYEDALRHLREQFRLMREIESEETRRQIHQIDTRHRVADAEKEAQIERIRNIELRSALEELEAAHLELKRTQTQLVQSEKMASLGQLTAGVAHEINNPINYVSASLPSLERDLMELHDLVSPNPGCEEETAELIEEMRQLLRSTREGARRVAEIVAGLRIFSRLDEGDRKPTDLHEGIESTLSLLRSRLDGRIAIIREYGDLPAVECYPGEINQVFMNILANAIDAIGTEGAITIATTDDSDMAHIAITDTGIGIAVENLERIFDPFFTTKDVGKGTGLGLAIAFGIIKKHGGTITVESTVGSGTTFHISLPLLPR